MKRKIRLGVLGAGGILGAHIPGFRSAAELSEVVAVAEPLAGKAERIRELFGRDIDIYSDYNELLEKADVDAVDIILPHYLHLPATLAAAKAGKHVLVEKVMARNIYECDQMIAAAKAAGVSLTVCHDRRYHGEWQALKDIVDSGVLGEIFFWKLDHNQDVALPKDSWAYSRDGLGGGSIMSCLTHQIDALRWYGGEVESVTCMSIARPERMEGEFAGVLGARMRSGALAELSINWWTRSNKGANCLWYEMVQVCGSKGEAYRMNGRGTFVRLHDPGDKLGVKRYGKGALDGFVKVKNGDWQGHERCIVEWVKMLRGEKANIVTDGTECRGTVEVAEAAYLSEKKGRTVGLPIRPRKWRSAGNRKILNGTIS
ncbi:MAG: hypothetical protein A2X49_03870 [Lentisphaerae bacterium GWF2_52_8]|nr:MAG: hypothetical protein A2X49_03870 [Lentisphaerae bacterium GWF2_52_8]